MQIKQQRDKVKQYQLRVETKLETERQLAKTLLQKGQRDRAKLLLKKKKYQEQLLEKAEGQIENLERLIQDLEFSQVEMKVLDGLKVGNDALKKMNALMSIDEIEKIMDETREGIDKQNEISELLSGALTAEDEMAVEEEFEALISLDKEEQEVPLDLPEIPEEEPQILEKEKEKPTKLKKKVALEAS